MSKVKVVKIGEGSYGKDFAHLQQDISKTYPKEGGQKFSNSLGTGLFADKTEYETFTSIRNTVINIPKGTTQSQVEAQLSKFPGAVIYRILSNKLEDVLSDEDKWSLNNGKTDPDEMVKKYVNRNKDGKVYANGKLIGNIDALPTSGLEFKRHIFSATHIEDKDLRTIVGKGSSNNTDLEEAFTAPKQQAFVAPVL